MKSYKYGILVSCNIDFYCTLKVILHEVLALSALSFLRVQLILHESKVQYSFYYMPTANSKL